MFLIVSVPGHCYFYCLWYLIYLFAASGINLFHKGNYICIDNRQIGCLTSAFCFMNYFAIGVFLMQAGARSEACFCMKTIIDTLICFNLLIRRACKTQTMVSKDHILMLAFLAVVVTITVTDATSGKIIYYFTSHAYMYAI